MNLSDNSSIMGDWSNDGISESYTVRVANRSTPRECESKDFSPTACGVVIEFIDIIDKHQMNPYSGDVGNVNGNGNAGGWEYGKLRTYLNNNIYNLLPNDLKNVIVSTKVISGRT